MRTTEDVSRFQQEAARRLERLREQEKKLAKDKSARGRLAHLDTQVRHLEAQESRVKLDREEAQLKLKALEEEYADAVAREGINVDGSLPPGSKQERIATEITNAREKLAADLWEARLRGLAQARRSVEDERSKYASEHFDELDAELKAEGTEIEKEVQKVAAQIAAVEDRWQAQARAYLALEQASGGPTVRGRLDVPAFPLKAAGGDSRPVPRVLEEDADPTITSEPIVFAGGR